jgi:hypothetical protein
MRCVQTSFSQLSSHVYLPQVYLEVVLSFVLILAAQILPLRFEPIRQMARAARARTWAEATSRPEFALLNSQTARFAQRTERARAVQQQMKR